MWIVKVKTEGGTYVCDCSQDQVAGVINAAYDEFGVCAVVARPV